MSGIENRSFDYDNNDKNIQENDDFELKLSEENKYNIDVLNNVPKANGFFGKISEFFVKQKRIIQIGSLIIFNCLVLAYFIYATYFYINKNSKCQYNCGMDWCDGYGMVLLLFVFIYFAIFYYQLLKPYFGEKIDNTVLRPIRHFISRLFKIIYIRIALIIMLVAAFATFIAIDTVNSKVNVTEKLQSLLGIGVLFILGFAFSKHPTRINWRPVIVGFTLQFLLGIFCIRWAVGRSIFSCIGEKVKTFLQYSFIGSSFVFGDEIVYVLKVFAFSVLPVIFFFSFCISILYYLGAMQWFIRKLGWILQSLLGTTVCESVTAAANIFLGMSESPLLIKPYIERLTHSELHSIMTSGFATVSGTVLAAYISFGADPAHLITSSVMAAPAALCYAKLFYPETEESQTTSKNMQMEKSADSSVLDAASNGATIAIPLILGIIANLIAFVSFIAFINGVMLWFGSQVGVDDFDLEWIFRRVCMPLAWLLGVPWSSCDLVGELIAKKSIINEFVAYQRLGEMKTAGLDPRSVAIATYAICGFANPSSMGIMIGALSGLAPQRRSAITSVAFRGFISGSFVCFITASIAGLLIPDEMVDNITKTIMQNTTELIFK